MEYEELLMFKTAWYYYMERLTQQNIAQILGISRMRVIKLLEKAQKNGVVQFKISKGHLVPIEIEKKLIKKYGLKDAFIVPTNPSDDDVNETISKAAAMYISDRVKNDDFVNIGYGDTLSRVLNNLCMQTDKTISFVSMTGGVNYYLQNMQNNFNNATLHLTPAPLLTSSKEMAEAFKNESAVKEISRLTHLSSMTIVGIGALEDNATIFKNGILSANDLLFLKMRGAVGDVLSHFIDKEGNLIETPYEHKIISTELETLRNLQNVIGVAAGSSKIEAIKAVLKNKYLDVLVTDEATANALLEEI